MPNCQTHPKAYVEYGFSGCSLPPRHLFSIRFRVEVFSSTIPVFFRSWLLRCTLPMPMSKHVCPSCLQLPTGACHNPLLHTGFAAPSTWEARATQLKTCVNLLWHLGGAVPHTVIGEFIVLSRCAACAVTHCHNPCCLLMRHVPHRGSKTCWFPHLLHELSMIGHGMAPTPRDLAAQASQA